MERPAEEGGRHCERRRNRQLREAFWQDLQRKTGEFWGAILEWLAAAHVICYRPRSVSGVNSGVHVNANSHGQKSKTFGGEYIRMQFQCFLTQIANNIMSLDDDQKRTRDEDEQVESVRNAANKAEAAAAAFKASLERFKHGPAATSKDISQFPIIPRRSARKHDLEEDQPKDPSPPKKKHRQTSQYAPPSKYAHLSPLTDIFAPNLICIFIGFNPGITTASQGHAYAHPSNMFWKLLHSSGCTDVRLSPTQDRDLPSLYSMGNTNIVARPSKNAAELSKAESAAGTPILEEKIAKWRPEAVCIVGKGIWESIWRWRYKRAIRKEEFRYGWQDDEERMGKGEGWEGARVFVATATSGLAANLRPHEKEAIWKPFGEWVKQRREERKIEQ